MGTSRIIRMTFQPLPSSAAPMCILKDIEKYPRDTKVQPSEEIPARFQGKIPIWNFSENSWSTRTRELNRKGQSSLRRLVVNFSQLHLLSSIVTIVVRMLVSLARKSSAVARTAKVRIVNSICLAWPRSASPLRSDGPMQWNSLV